MAIDPTINALTPSRWQISRATFSVSGSSGLRSHEAERLADAVLAHELKIRRLLDADRQCLAQRVVERRLAGRVHEIGDAGSRRVPCRPASAAGRPCTAHARSARPGPARPPPWCAGCGSRIVLPVPRCRMGGCRCVRAGASPAAGCPAPHRTDARACAPLTGVAPQPLQVRARGRRRSGSAARGPSRAPCR